MRTERGTAADGDSYQAEEAGRQSTGDVSQPAVGSENQEKQEPEHLPKRRSAPEPRQKPVTAPKPPAVPKPASTAGKEN